MVEMDCSKSDLKAHKEMSFNEIIFSWHFFQVKKQMNEISVHLITGQKLSQKDDRAFQSTWILMVSKGHKYILHNTHSLRGWAQC